MTSPIAGLDNTVHQRVRLGILTVLSEAERADFAYLRESLELADGNLSSNLATLEQAGYVEIEKEFNGRRPRPDEALRRGNRRRRPQLRRACRPRDRLSRAQRRGQDDNALPGVLG